MLSDQKPRSRSSRLRIILCVLGIALANCLGVLYMAWQPLFWWTLRNKHSKMIQLMLKLDPHLAYGGSYRNTPLALAIELNDLDSVSIILNYTNDRMWKETALKETIRQNKTDCMKLLLKQGVKAERGHLLLATELGAFEAADYMLQSYKFSKQDIYLVIGFSSNSQELISVKFFINKLKEYYPLEEFKPSGAFSSAAGGGKLETMKYLLALGADVHFNNEYPLGNSTIGGHISTTEFLLDLGADIHAKNDYVLRRVVELSHSYPSGTNGSNFRAVIRLLVRRGANLDVLTPEDRAYVESLMAHP
jgi:hypothetical protein